MQIIRRYSSAAADLEVPPTASAITKTDWSQLIMAPGVYGYNAYKYDLSVDGLYGILNPGVDGGYRIIYQSDVLELLKSISWLVAIGRVDETSTPAQLLTTMKTNKVGLRCGFTNAMLQYVLNSKGIQSRLVNIITADTPNGFDDGHVAAEVKIGGNWVFFDTLMGLYFNALAVKDIFDPFSTVQMTNTKPLSYDIRGSGSYQFATGVYADMSARSGIQITSWIYRIYNIPGIVHTDGLTYFFLPTGMESRASYVLSLSSNYRIISKAEFITKFYT